MPGYPGSSDIVMVAAFGIWHLAFGIWDLAFGIWHLAFGIWHGGNLTVQQPNAYLGTEQQQKVGPTRTTFLFHLVAIAKPEQKSEAKFQTQIFS